MVERLVLDGGNALSSSEGKNQMTEVEVSAQPLFFQDSKTRGLTGGYAEPRLQEALYSFEFDLKLVREVRHRLRRVA
jgi:hypothetical protein